MSGVARADGAGPRRSECGSAPESYAKVLANVGGMAAVLGAIAAFQLTGPRRPAPPKAAPTPAVQARSVPGPVVVSQPGPPPEVQPAPAPGPPKLDREAVARAEEALDAASRDRARAEARAEEAGRRLRDAAAQAVIDGRQAKTLAFRVRDPSARVTAASARGGLLAREKRQIESELTALARAPRPKVKVLSNKNPVARPAEGTEEHFELRNNRITHIDLERLLDKVKADAMLRIRLSDGARVVDARVGPIGAYSLQYVLARSLPAGLDELIERRGVRYDLRGWEVVPEFEGRGETFEATRQPISEFARVLGRLNPARNTLTLWIYPDSFDLFRKLRDDLHARGFLVAARPLPQGMAIRGSPAGSLSAGQ